MTRFLVLLVLSVATPALFGGEPDTEGFVPMFDGKTLKGWVNVNCHPSTFFVKEGVVITTGTPTGFLRTEKQYENFILEMEWKHIEKSRMANSGLFVWGDPLPAVGTPYTRGIEVQVLANAEVKDSYTSDGDVFSIWGATCKPDRPHPKGAARCLPSEKRTKPAGEWNHYKVIAQDGVLKLHVNGKEVSGVSQCSPRKGYLALESEGAECHFRNIRIKELPSTNPKPDQIATLAQGHTLLFNGLDLAGWSTEKDSWKAGGGILKAAGTADLVSAKTYERFELIFDCRTPAKGAGDWSVEFGTNQLHTITNAGTPGKWSRVMLTVTPDEVKKYQDGRLISTAKPGVERGPIRFKPGAGLELMSLYVRELPAK